MNYRTVQILPTFSEFAAFNEVLNLAGRTWTFVFEWRPRLASWFCSVYDDLLAPVFEGRRVVVGSNLSYGVLAFPGNLVVLGRNDNDQTQLGRSCAIVYVELESDD
jgi:hypothetical protein